MINHGRFVSTFDATTADLPTGPPDVTCAAEGSGSRSRVVTVQPRGGQVWTGTFAAPDPGRPALSALLGTPDPAGLCIVERGTAFLGDVLEPASFGVIATTRPVVSAEALPRERVLLLLSPWAITAIGERGVLWTTPRLAVDGIRLDEADGGWVRGVADPDDDEPRDVAVELATGRVRGGRVIG
ncbi:hypothetical protein [Aeromicrobium sp. CnD17-E]|uniref:hypothetical protein n=1 Tax=Aeromicrobium sp. CnD17-E TaxID=2954487 RepID=UPI002096ACFA|nr:hypothetical protein [Aeromicrobium sp. CnD17-E]MCO7237731.1 hypothetical protein [Aeromicrobium sp. CnD17-E]